MDAEIADKNIRKRRTVLSGSRTSSSNRGSLCSAFAKIITSRTARKKTRSLWPFSRGTCSLNCIPGNGGRMGGGIVLCSGAVRSRGEPDATIFIRTSLGHALFMYAFPTIKREVSSIQSLSSNHHPYPFESGSASYRRAVAYHYYT